MGPWWLTWHLCLYICEKCEMSRLWRTNTRTHEQWKVEQYSVWAESAIRSRSTISAIPSRSSPLALAKPLSACCHRIAWVKNTSNPPVWFLFKIQDEDVPWTQMIFFKFVRNLYILSPHKIMMITNKLENGFSVFYSTMLILSWCWSTSPEKGSQCNALEEHTCCVSEGGREWTRIAR